MLVDNKRSDLARKGFKELLKCIGCGKCRENCPLELDIPEIIKTLRSTGVSSEFYYFLKSHMVWVYYQSLLRLGAGKA